MKRNPIKLPYLNIQKDRNGNNKYCYFRRGQVRARIDDDEGVPLLPDDPGFLRAYERIALGFDALPKLASSGSVADLIAKFRASAAYNNNIGAGSRYQYGLHMRFLEENYGHIPAKDFDTETVADMLDALQDTPRKANYLRTTIRRIWGWGRQYSRTFKITQNPADNVEKLKTHGGFRPWTADELETFAKSAPEMMKVAFALALHTGQRRGDIARMLWSAYDGEAIEVIQSKTGNRAWVPAGSELRAVLDAAPRRGAVILTTDAGGAFTPEYLGQAFHAAVRAAGLPTGDDQHEGGAIVRAGCHFHGLRKNAGVELAEAGCSAHQIMAILGCSLANAEYYRREAGQRELATAAIAKREVARKAKRRGG